MYRPSDVLPQFALAALLGGVMAPYVLLGVPLFDRNSGHDAMFHLEILAWLTEEPWRGVLPAIWFFNASSGLGSPPAVFYGVGAYLPALLFQWLGAGPDMALSLAMAGARAAGGIGVAAWAMRRGAAWPAASVAAAVFLLSPFTMLNSPLMSFRFAEAAATGLLPWLLLVSDRPLRPGRALAFVVPVGVGFGLLAITHLQSTVFAAIVVPAWSLAVHGRAAAVHVALGGVLGAGLAAWLLVPALTMRGLINEAGWDAATRMAEAALFGPWLFGDWAVQPDSWPFWATLYGAWAIGTGLGLAGLLRRPSCAPPWASRHAAAFALALGLTMVPPIVWLLPHLPIIVHVQFPWRHLHLLGLFAGLVAAGFWGSGGAPRRWVGAWLLILSLQLPLPWAASLLPERFAAVDPALLLHFPPDRAASASARARADYTPLEYLPAAAMRTSFDWSEQATRQQALASICAEEACAIVDRSIPGRLGARLAPGGAGLLVPHFFWPGLVCDTCDLSLDARTGLVRAVPRPGQPVEVVLRVEALAPQRIGTAISAAAALCLLLLAGLALRPAVATAQAARLPP